jgi:hypothetical protein
MFSKQDIEKYFFAEKQIGLLFIVIGALALVLAIVFFLLLKTNFYKGAAVPLLVIGLVQLAVGFTVYRRSDADRKTMVYSYDMDPSRIRNEELPRMQKVMKNFTIIKWVEIIFIAAGLFLIYYYRFNTEKAFWFGVGLTLTIQSILMLVADFSAEKRGRIYTAGLTQFLEKVK